MRVVGVASVQDGLSHETPDSLSLGIPQRTSGFRIEKLSLRKPCMCVCAYVCVCVYFPEEAILNAGHAAEGRS